jgi:hypothetical protein
VVDDVEVLGLEDLAGVGDERHGPVRGARRIPRDPDDGEVEILLGVEGGLGCELVQVRFPLAAVVVVLVPELHAEIQRLFRGFEDVVVGQQQRCSNEDAGRQRLRWLASAQVDDPADRTGGGNAPAEEVRPQRVVRADDGLEADVARGQAGPAFPDLGGGVGLPDSANRPNAS